jgi:hypothetical protein
MKVFSLRNLLFPLALVTLIALSPKAYADQYVILHIKGSLKLASSGKALKAGDKVDEKAKVIFGTASTMAAVFHPSRGRFILKPQSQDNGSSELSTFLSETIVAGRSKMSTKAGKLTNDLEFQALFEANPKEYFEGNFLLFSEETAFEFALGEYPQDAGNFFFIRYQYQGDHINKKIPVDGNRFLINTEELFKVDGNPITPSDAKELTLYLRDAANSASRKICQIRFKVIDKTALTNELHLIKPYLSGLGRQERINEVIGYLADTHGRADEDALVDFLKENMPGLLD